MGVDHLLSVLGTDLVPGGSLPVDLVTLAAEFCKNGDSKEKFKLVIDAEGCLDRLYGGFFSDWISGGQWVRALDFLTILTDAIRNANIQITLFFDGTVSQLNHKEWITKQASNRQKINSVFRHIGNKGTPPPKVWWIPPTGLLSVLRLAFRHLGMNVICTVEDHRQEVISFCREMKVNGLLGNAAEYLLLQPPRYFSSDCLKLTYAYCLETREFEIKALLQMLAMPEELLPLLASLLGNQFLSETDLIPFYEEIGLTGKISDNITVITKIGDWLKNTYLENDKNIAKIIKLVFPKSDRRASSLYDSVHYYKEVGNQSATKYKSKRYNIKLKQNKKGNSNNGNNKTERKKKHYSRKYRGSREDKTSSAKAVNAVSTSADSATVPQDDPNDASSERSEELNGQISPLPGNSDKQNRNNLPRPTVPSFILSISFERHQKGLMSPLIYQILSSNEIRLPVLMEDDMHREFPPIQDFYRPLRQKVYAILFNLHHQTYTAKVNCRKGKGEIYKPPVPVIIREWVWSKDNAYERPEVVAAVSVDWPVPTVQRLWRGRAMDDSLCRMRAFLSCMHSDTLSMIGSCGIPRHYLMLCAVLRYILVQNSTLLRRSELDAVLAAAMVLKRHNVHYLQDISVTSIRHRSIQLSTLIMQGLEYAMFANEACGSPIMWVETCPWLYFDGKLFHTKLEETMLRENIFRLCEEDEMSFSAVNMLEQMRKIIIQGLDVGEMFYLPYGIETSASFLSIRSPPSLPLRVGNYSAMRNRGRVYAPINTRGGRLKVAGTVVGQWGPNYTPTVFPHLQNQVPQHRRSRNYNRGFSYRVRRDRHGDTRRPPHRMRKSNSQGATTSKSTTTRSEKPLQKKDDGKAEASKKSEEKSESQENSEELISVVNVSTENNASWADVDETNDQKEIPMAPSTGAIKKTKKKHSNKRQSVGNRLLNGAHKQVSEQVKDTTSSLDTSSKTE